jgi:hypothetical protein
MREYTLQIEKALKIGLRPSDRTPPNKGVLVEAQGVIQESGELFNLENLEAFDISDIEACIFPFPQVFKLIRWTLICTPTRVYTYRDGVVTLVYTGAEASTWTVADFYDFLLLTNGNTWIELDPETASWCPFSDDEVPSCLCLCDLNGQLFVGGPGATVGAGWLGD